MTLTDFRARLRSEHHLFTDTLAFIAEHYSYTPSAFDNGSVSNPAGQNEGSCKTLGFAILEGLSLEETLLAFGEHYRAVRDNPEGDDHANIRALQQTGLAGVHSSASPCRAGAEKSRSPPRRMTASGYSPYRPLHSDPRQPSPPAGLADTRRKKAGPHRGPRPSRRRKRGAASVTAWRWRPRWT